MLCSKTRARRHGCALLAATAMATVPQAARADGGRAPSGTCAAGTIEPLARRVAPSVVRVEAPGGVATGFVFGSDRLVIAPLTVVEAGRGIVIHGRAGDVRRPTVRLADPDHDIALLEMASPLPGALPLAPSSEPIERGTTALAVGTTELLAPADAFSPGTITRVTGDRFLTSARVGFHATWGSPLLDCEGRVLGVANSFSDEALRVDALPALVERASLAAEYSPEWTVAPGIGLAFSYGPRGPWLGASLGAALVHDDRVEISARGQVFAFLHPDEPEKPKDTGLALGLDARVGYRFMLTEGMLPLYFVPSVGAIGTLQWRWRTEASAAVNMADCSPSDSCPMEQQYSTRLLGDRAWISPVLGAAFRLAPLELGYSLRLDSHELSGSTHMVTFGVQF